MILIGSKFERDRASVQARITATRNFAHARFIVGYLIWV